MPAGIVRLVHDEPLTDVYALSTPTVASVPDEHTETNECLFGVFVMMKLDDPPNATATKRDSSGDQQIFFHLPLVIVWFVQFIPSGDVVRIFASATATKRDSSGDQQTEFPMFGDVLAVQVMPSGDVIA